MKRRKVELEIPAWAAGLYSALSIILVPWTIYLGVSLPAHHLSNHWDASWVGLDSAIVVALLATGILAARKSRLVVLSAAALASFLLVDAWFDIMSERSPGRIQEAIILAVLVELPLAFISYRLAYVVLHERPV